MVNVASLKMFVDMETKDVIMVGGVKVEADAEEMEADVVLQWAKNQARKIGIQIGRGFPITDWSIQIAMQTKIAILQILWDEL